MTPTTLIPGTATAAGAATAPPTAWTLRRPAAPIPLLLAAVLAALGVALVTARRRTGARPARWLPVPVVVTLAVAAAWRSAGRVSHGPPLLTATWPGAIFPGAP